MTSTDPAAGGARAAAFLAGLLIAFQVAGRATRDALFLSHFSVTTLPRMIAIASLVALVAAVAASRALARYGPARLLPVLFIGSAMLQLLEWAMLGAAPRAATVLVYLHISALGALLVSGFWSLVNERFDPRTAKRVAGSIGTAATFGGVAGGLMAERAGALLTVPAMLPALAAMHLACAVLVARVAVGRAEGIAAAGVEPAGLRALAGSSYLRVIAAVLVLGAVGEGLLDYVFKAAAQGVLGNGDALLRLFALFYTVTNLLAVAASAGLGAMALQRLGLARTVGLLPWSVVLGSAGAIALPGFVSAVLAKGIQAVTLNSVYRLGYELLYTPLPPAEKRAAKPILDVGAIRVGDLLAAGLIQVALMAAMHATTLMLVFATGTAIAGILLTLRLHEGYVSALERGLMSRAVQLDMDDVLDATTRQTLAHTLAAMPPVVVAGTSAQTPAAVAAPRTLAADPELARLAALRSPDAARVAAALGAAPLGGLHVTQAITLLAWDQVSRQASVALAAVASRHAGQLADALVDPATDFAVRRRLPALLATARTVRAAEALLGGLDDQRFEVRFRCGLALARLTAGAPDVAVPADRVLAAILREVAVDQRLWEERRLLDDTADDPLELGDLVRERASRSLEHVFTLLSLVLPRQPLRIAFRGLHTDDPQLRGTALEYLETALPPAVRERLWPFIGDAPAPRHRSRSPEEVAADLFGSRESIAANLARPRQGSGHR